MHTQAGSTVVSSRRRRLILGVRSRCAKSEHQVSPIRRCAYPRALASLQALKISAGSAWSPKLSSANAYCTPALPFLTTTNPPIVSPSPLRLLSFTVSFAAFACFQICVQVSAVTNRKRKMQTLPRRFEHTEGKLTAQSELLLNNQSVKSSTSYRSTRGALCSKGSRSSADSLCAAPRRSETCRTPSTRPGTSCPACEQDELFGSNKRI